MSALFLLPRPLALRRARAGEAVLIALSAIVVALFLVVVAWQESRALTADPRRTEERA